MDESPEKIALKTLTLSTVKALSKIEKLLNEAPDKKRDNNGKLLNWPVRICTILFNQGGCLKFE